MILFLRLFIFLILVPGMQLCILCITVGDDPKLLNIGFVNKEKVDLFDCLTPKNESTGCSLEGLSCNYLTKLPKEIVSLVKLNVKLIQYKRLLCIFSYTYILYFSSVQISYKTEEEARSAVKNGDIWGFMSFPEGYSFNLYAKAAGMALNGSMEASQILLEMDMTSET